MRLHNGHLFLIKNLWQRGHTIAEIAAQIGCSDDAVERHLLRCLALKRAHLRTINAQRKAEASAVAPTRMPLL